MKCVIEVGANSGSNTIELKTNYPETTVYAFEPTHELLTKYLWPLYSNDENVKILPFAVDEKNGFRTFNIAGSSDWGCSSLYNFNENIHNEWLGRTDFNVTHSYIVPTITLFDFCELYDIDEIEYLWIDAQGHDFACLKSLREKILIVKKGKCEASLNVELYSETANRAEDIKKWLENLGFSTKVVPDKSGIDAECDVHFWR
jgi:FkbM family methyltransferase